MIKTLQSIYFHGRLYKNHNRMTKFIIESGNWKATVKMDKKLSDITFYDYMEASTRAVECIFKESKDISEDFDIIELRTADGQNYFSQDFKGNLSEMPDPTFGLLIRCFLEKHLDDREEWWYSLSSKVFANAALHANARLAESIEEKHPEEVAEFKNMEKMLANMDEGEREKLLKKEKSKFKRNNKKKT